MAKLVALTVLAPLLVLGGCSAAGSSGVEPTDSLAVGDCLLAPTARGDSAKVVDCTRPHSGQVVGIYRAIGGPYPGPDLLAGEAQSYCASAFTEFVGSDPLTSVLDLFPLLPTESAWDEGDVFVVCVAATFDNVQVRQTFKNSHR